MNKFNLTFSGEIQADHDPARVKLRFGKMFAIEDPVRLERFFSGQTIILRRNLERKAAAQYYHELHLLGVVPALVKVTASAAAEAIVKVPSPPPSKAPDTSQRDTTDIAAQIKARKAESLQQAAQKAAREKSALEEQQRRAAQDHAREQAKAAETRRLVAEQTARRAAEKQSRAEEDAARREAIATETRRQAAEKAAEEAARRAVEREESKRREAEARRKAAAEAAQRKAEREEIQRQEAEESARLQAELEDIKRQEVEEAARIKAAAQLKQAEAQRQSAERRRAAADKVAAQRAKHKEDKRNAAARQTAQKAQKAQQIRQKAEDAARHKAEQLEKEAQEQLEHAALNEALHEKAVQRAAEKLTQSTVSKPAKALVKTSLEVPQRKTSATPEEGAPGPRKRQSGEPNLYKLRPFRNTEEVRARAGLAQQRVRQSYTLGTLAVAALLLIGGSFFRHATDPVITGASSVAIDPQSGPVVLAGRSLLFHDRAGVSTNEVRLSTLGVSALEAPLAFDDSGALLALGRLLADAEDPAGATTSQLLRCELALSTCQHFSPELADRSIGAFVIHPLDGSLLLADTAVGQLLKVSRAGKIVARASVPIPEHPVLRLHGGLLLMNSAEGPGISVLRYEDSAFGQQLDEILLLPPPAQQAQQSRVGDFIWSGNAWWASLYNPESEGIGLYRFDSEWNYLDEVVLPVASGPLQLSNWGTKILVSDSRHLPIQRFNAQGAVEAPFVSTQLAELVAERQGHGRLTTLAWRGSLLVCALTAALGFGFGYLHSLRRLVYKPRREQGAEPIDDYTDALLWIDPVQSRPTLLHRWSFRYGLLLLGILLLAIAQSVTPGLLAALLLALSGPGIALLLLSRRPIGHIGILQDRLLLVDHSGLYHLARGSSVQYRGPFLAIDDVVVFCGNHLLPAFSPLQLQNLVSPLALGGVKVDRNTLVVKLLQSRHPFALGACAILATATTAAMLLCLQGIF